MHKFAYCIELKAIKSIYASATAAHILIKLPKMTPFSGMYPSLADTCATKPTWLLEKEILSKLERDMLQYIDTRSLIPLLKSKGMISQDDEEHINRLGDGCRKQSKYILEIIPKKVNY